LLLGAVAAEAAFLVLVLAVPAIAGLLDHAPPGALGLAVAALAFPAVVLADTTDKWVRVTRGRGPR
jgi:hypothetical protein